MKEIRKTFVAFTATEQTTLERARDICQTGYDFAEDSALTYLFGDFLDCFDALEKYAIDQFEYDESEVIGTYETDDTFSKDSIAYEENVNENENE